MKKFTLTMLMFAVLPLLAGCLPAVEGGNTTAPQESRTPAEPPPAYEQAAHNPLETAALPTEAETTQPQPEIGSIYTFGGHDWRVLDIQNNQALLLSDKVLETRAYHGYKMSAITWEESDIRQYLNNDFYNRLPEADRNRIAQTTVANNDNPWFGTAGGNDTSDKIFLLSIEEAVKYFGDSGQLQNQNEYLWWGIDDQYNNARIAYDTSGNADWWWLRSPGIYAYNAAHVRASGILSIYGFSGYRVVGGSVYRGVVGVRPALWLNLQTAQPRTTETAPPLPPAAHPFAVALREYFAGGMTLEESRAWEAHSPHSPTAERLTKAFLVNIDSAGTQGMLAFRLDNPYQWASRLFALYNGEISYLDVGPNSEAQLGRTGFPVAMWITEEGRIVEAHHSYLVWYTLFEINNGRLRQSFTINATLHELFDDGRDNEYGLFGGFWENAQTISREEFEDIRVRYGLDGMTREWDIADETAQILAMTN